MCSQDDVVEDKPETPGETPDPQVAGLGGQRPLGLVDSTSLMGSNLATNVLPSVPPPPVAKRGVSVTPPPVPPRLDPEVSVFLLVIIFLNIYYELFR